MVRGINRFHWRVLGTTALSALGLGFFGLAGAAYADPLLSATAAYSLGGGGTTTVPNPASPPADILPAAGASSNSIFGHVYSYDSGLNGSRSSGQNTYSINGTSEYTTTYTNTGSAPATYYFNYAIAPGGLGVFVDTRATGSQSAALSAIIKVNGLTAFDYESSMSLTSGGVVSFLESGAVLAAGGPTIQSDGGSYSWSEYDGSVYLGSLNPGQSVTVDYTLFSSAIGSMSDVGACSGGYGYNTSTPYGYSNNNCISTAIARIGDPFSGSQLPDPPAVFGVVDVPEPVSMAGLGVGLATLALSRRRRRAG